ncbi:RNA polymerase sigma factor [Chitinophaga caseinilytica]|uniref:RNA polymerase sigma factor n=1 Tax=Chitinophaga caseinilytica TaxID=2267521 RepID=UPI003C2ED380
MDQLSLININQLFNRISEGDEEAFGILFRTSVSALLPFILRMVKQQAAAEEVVQASFLRVWLSRDKLSEVEQPKAWLYKVVANECYTWMRKEAREMRLRAGAAAGEEQTDDSLQAELSMRETRRLVAEAVAKMPAQRKRVFTMSRQQGMKIPEIAEMLGLSPNSVKNTLVLALKDVRAYLSRHGRIIPLLLLCWNLNGFDGWTQLLRVQNVEHTVVAGMIG